MMLGHFPMVHVLFSVLFFIYALKATQIKISLKHHNQHIYSPTNSHRKYVVEHVLLFFHFMFYTILHPFFVNSPLLFYKLEPILQKIGIYMEISSATFHMWWHQIPCHFYIITNKITRIPESNGHNPIRLLLNISMSIYLFKYTYIVLHSKRFSTLFIFSFHFHPPFGCSSFRWPYSSSSSIRIHIFGKFTCISHLFLLLVVNWKENLIE